jgi:GTP pyrophosphokinase
MEDFLKSIPHNFSQKDQQLLKKALTFASKAHAGQVRKSGEPYITHPITAH